MFAKSLTLMLKSRNTKPIHDNTITILRYIFIKIVKYLDITLTLSVRDNSDIKIRTLPGCTISEKLFVVGLYDYNGMSFLLEKLRTDDIFYDIGANIGPFSLLANRVTPNIYAFEGHPETTKRLKENFKLNGIAENKALNMAISEKPGEINFRDEAGSAINKILESDGNGIIVKCTSVDAFSKKHGIPRFIKIDTEGHEVSVIRGMKKSLSSGLIDYISFEANGLATPNQLEEIFNELMSNNFNVGILDFNNKEFHVKNTLGEKSESGDYQALSKKLQNVIISQGYSVILS
jgi:FkbM family methyltransferase